MVRRADNDDSPGPQIKGLTVEEAEQRIESLRRVYDQGYIPRDLYETLKREIEARVEETR